MDKIHHIETSLGLELPDDYKRFLLSSNCLKITNKAFSRILQDGYCTDGLIDAFYTVDNFLEQQHYRDYLVETQKHFGNSTNYVEAEHLYYIASGASGSICIALGGKHFGKIYSVDNGDFGIVYQSINIDAFIDSLYDFSIKS